MSTFRASRPLINFSSRQSILFRAVCCSEPAARPLRQCSATLRYGSSSDTFCKTTLMKLFSEFRPRSPLLAEKRLVFVPCTAAWRCGARTGVKLNACLLLGAMHSENWGIRCHNQIHSSCLYGLIARVQLRLGPAGALRVLYVMSGDSTRGARARRVALVAGFLAIAMVCFIFVAVPAQNAMEEVVSNLAWVSVVGDRSQLAAWKRTRGHFLNKLQSEFPKRMAAAMNFTQDPWAPSLHIATEVARHLSVG
jgi:hypothetical protein